MAYSAVNSNIKASRYSRKSIPGCSGVSFASFNATGSHIAVPRNRPGDQVIVLDVHATDGMRHVKSFDCRRFDRKAYQIELCWGLETTTGSLAVWFRDGQVS